MWKCKKCLEDLEDQFDVCWNCGSDQLGNRKQDFQINADILKRSEPNSENPIKFAGHLLSNGAKSILNSMIAVVVNIIIGIIMAFMIGLNEIKEEGVIFLSIIEFIISVYSIYLFVNGFIQIKKSGEILMKNQAS